VIAPLAATVAFQRLGHGWPFNLAGGFVALIGVMTWQLKMHRPAPATPGEEKVGAA
jgi:hypothetical protein